MNNKILPGLAVVTMFIGAGAIAQDEDAVKGTTVNGDPLSEDSCEILAGAPNQKAEMRYVPGMHVIDRKEDHPLAIAGLGDVKVSAVICWRSAARFASNDYLVPLKIGCPLVIKTDAGDGSTGNAVVLEISGGSFRVRKLAGPDWTKSQEDEVIAVLNLFEKKKAGADAR